MPFIREIIRSLDIKKSTIGSIIFALPFALGFSAAGIFIFTSEFLTPYLESKQAQNWTQVEATVIKSKIKRNDDSYNIALKYHYKFQDNKYTGDRFELSTAGRNFSTDTYKETAKNYPKGSKIPIWVNPQNPQQSVYKRGMVTTNWIALPFSIPFITIGACALCYILFNNAALRIQNRARKEIAQLASRHSATQIHNALIDPEFGRHPHSEITFLKHNHILNSLGLLFLILFWNGIVSVFLIFNISMHIAGESFAYLISIFLIPFACVGISFTYKFITSLLSGIGEDYLILSNWDPEFTTATHHWLLLTDQRDTREISFYTTAFSTKKHKLHKQHKQLLKTNPITDTFKTPDKTVIKGTITHPITGSSEHELQLIIYTKNQTKDRLNKHNLTLYSPPSD